MNLNIYYITVQDILVRHTYSHLHRREIQMGKYYGGAIYSKYRYN